MKRVLWPILLAVLLLLVAGLSASALDPSPPAVTGIGPAQAFNDIDTQITITGGNFANSTFDASGGVVAAVPQVTLGTTALANVTWVDTQTLTATVPWGMDPGIYPLSVKNPDGATSVSGVTFTVVSGINTWNAGELNGAYVPELLMKPGDPNTLYALVYDVGLFRSRDAGATWTFTSAEVIGNAVFDLDLNPGHECWLYSFMASGLYVSKDEGDTWAKLPFAAQDANGSPPSHEVFVWPHNPTADAADTLFVATYGSGTYSGYMGLQKSVDGGQHWTVIPSMVGTAVQSVAFDPTPGSQNMVLATSDARVFTSSDLGETWTQVASPPATTLGMYGYVMYNPFYAAKPGEVWFSSAELGGGVFKSSGSLASWTKALPNGYTQGYKVSFAGPSDVYMWEQHSTDGGATWTQFGPWPTWGWGEYVFNPSDPRTIYFTNSREGVQKTTNGGASWATCNQGLTGMRCVQMSVSRINPLHVRAVFDGWAGIFDSTDGAGHWKYTEIPDSGQMWQVIEDPFQDGRLYASGGGFYTSTDDGATWHGPSWDTLLPGRQSGVGMMTPLVADPHQPGHLLVGERQGLNSTHDHDAGYLFESNDWGATWHAVSIVTPIDSLAFVGGIAFDPDVAGTVYVATGGTGVYRGVESGSTWAWTRIDNGSAQMADCFGIAIATHPRRVLMVSGLWGQPFRSFDDGLHWENKEPSGGGVGARYYAFVDHDSTRLYAPDFNGLHFSGNVGDTWTDAAGALGSVQCTTLNSANVDGHTLLYAATTGGRTGIVQAGPRLAVAAVSSGSLVGAGIYRRAQVSQTATFTSTGSRDGWVLESGERTSKGGSMNSGSATLLLGDNASRKQYRAILSFPTAGLPDSAVITRVSLRLRKQGIAGGGNPVTKFQGFMADVRRGYFGTSVALQISDFQASASRTLGAWKPALIGGWYTLDLTSAAGYVNKLSSSGGVTQVRVRFRLDDDNNRTANYLSVYSGNASGASRPQLVVTYYVP